MRRNSWFQCLLLAKIQLMGAMGVNRLIHTGNAAEKRRMALMALVFAGLAAAMTVYALDMARGLAAAGLADIIPQMALAICAVITITTTFIKSNGTLFGFGDYDLIMALPVGGMTVIISRLLSVYMMNLLISALGMCPALAVYALHAGAGAGIWLMAAASLFIAPLLPMVLASVFGAVITAVSVRFRYSNLVVMALGVGFVLAVMAGSFSAVTISDAEQLTNIGLALSGMMRRVYYPSLLFSKAVVEGDAVYFMLFAVLSMGVSALFVAVLSRFYARINSAIYARRAGRGFRLRGQKAASPFVALYKREFKRLLSSPIYMMNTCMGAVLLLAGAVALAVSGDAQAMLNSAGMGELTAMLAGSAPLMLSLFVALSNTACVSVSLEGKSRWIIMALPVRPKLLYGAKIALNLTITVPSALIGAAALTGALNCGAAETLAALIVPLCYALLCAVAGLAINVKLPKFDWRSEQQAVKQSMAPMMAVLLGIGSVMGPYFAVMLMPEPYRLPATAATGALALITAALIWRWLGRRKLVF